MKKNLKQLKDSPIRDAVGAGRLTEISDADLKAVVGGMRSSEGNDCFYQIDDKGPYWIHTGYPESA